MQTETQKFDQWCLVELFGHQKIAGRCTEQNIAGTNFLRVDVPENESQPGFTKFFGAGAIYAINPVDQATAELFARNLKVAPVAVWQAESFIEKMKNNPKALPGSDNDFPEDDE